VSPDAQQSKTHQQRRSSRILNPPIWSDDTQLVTASAHSPWFSALACLLFIAALAFVAGIVGAVAGITAVGVWYLLGAPSAVAVGTVLTTATIAQPVDPLTGILISTPLLILVIAPVATTPHGITATMVGLTTAGVLAGSGVILLQWFPLWLVGATLLGILGFAAYSQHRYLLLRVGLLEETDEQSMTVGDSPSRQTSSERYDS
jgi:hypothetical protein